MQTAFPGSKHVRECCLETADDEKIWKFAGENGFTIASKDSDFLNRALLRGHPPKLIYVRLGNCSTDFLRTLLFSNAKTIEDFGAAGAESLLILGQDGLSFRVL